MNEQEIFAAAIKLQGIARANFVKAACANNVELLKEVESLLRAHDDSQGIIPIEQVELLGSTKPFTGNPHPGDLISGRYKLLELIGEGGMGMVWLAEQREPVKRKVAIKLVKAGMDSHQVLARFEAERQALALMDHPNIAKVFDGGVTEQGRPFFVMEFVKGVPLTDYCDEARLSIKQRLALFIPICQAVQHAHQKGIIHRDLKPSNLLVCLYDGKPIPKVIDFGLAKAMHQSLTESTIHTAIGMMVGTPLYMSPEQAELNNLDIDTRTDVYSLGVILYELLTGSTPLERQQLKKAAYVDILRLIKEFEPPRPSTKISGSKSLPNIAAQRSLEPRKLSRILAGDLDWIVMKSLEKERCRRYETANGLARDIERYLRDDNVEATPPTAAYRLKKFAKKHFVTLGTMTTVSLALVLGIALSTWQAYRASLAESRMKGALDKEETQRKRAEENEAAAIAAVKSFRDAIANNPELRNSPQLEGLRKQLLREPLEYFKHLRERLVSESASSPKALLKLANAQVELGHLLREIGDRSDALTAYTECLATHSRNANAFPTAAEYEMSLAQIQSYIGNAHRDLGHVDEALNSYDRAIEIVTKRKFADLSLAEQLLGAQCQYNKGVVFFEGRSLESALAAANKSSDLRQEIALASPQNIENQKGQAACHNLVGMTLLYLGREPEGLQELEKGIQIQSKLIAKDPANTSQQVSFAGSLTNLAYHYRATGDFVAATESLNRAGEAIEKVKPLVNSQVTFQDVLAKWHLGLADVHVKSRRFDRASVELEHGVAKLQLLAGNHPSIARFQEDLAAALQALSNVRAEMSQLDLCIRELDRAHEIAVRLVEQHPSMARYHSLLATVLGNQGTIANRVGDFSVAKSRHLEAIREFRFARSLNPQDRRDIGFLENAYKNLIGLGIKFADLELITTGRRGLIELSLGEKWRESIEQIEKDVAKNKEMGDANVLRKAAEQAYDAQVFSVALQAYECLSKLQPDPAQIHPSQDRYNAACCAALAASGQSLGKSPPDDKERTQLRRSAHSWLTSEFNKLTRLMDSLGGTQRQEFIETLRHWQSDIDLYSVRERVWLEKLPLDEQEQWQSLWKAVEEACSTKEASQVK
jgi:serine/threonine protein kinase